MLHIGLFLLFGFALGFGAGRIKNLKGAEAKAVQDAKFVKSKL